MFSWIKPQWAGLLEKNPQEVIDQLVSPGSSDDYFALAMAHDQLGQLPQVERNLREALRRNLSHLPSIYALGIKLLQKNKEPEAKTYLRRALRLDPDASETALQLLRDFRVHLNQLTKANDWGIWVLSEVETQKKANLSTFFQLGKLQFERSQYELAAEYLLKSIEEPEVSSEATEYLSYIYEHLYKGDELIDKILELAERVPQRADLFFNLAMVCQHDYRRLELALHFFYLASQEDSADPGLKFSLEQAAIELMNQMNRLENPDRNYYLMIAHLYQGSLGVAKHYAESLSDWRYPESFMVREPQKLWRDWLVRDKGVLGQALQAWFGSPEAPKKIHSLIRL